MAPGLFAANADGQGVAAAVAVKVSKGGSQTSQLIFQCANGPGTCTTLPVDLGTSEEQVFLLLFGTGIRGVSSEVKVTIAGQDVAITGAVPQEEFAGLDQVNVGPLPRSLAGRADVPIVLMVDGKPANTVTVSFQPAEGSQ